METLATQGYLVIPAPPGTQELRSQILQETTNLPEFETTTTPHDLSLGGFCALGLPSTFHLPSVRKARKLAHPYVRNILARDGYLFEQLPDRLLIRPPGRKVMRESWHRDEAHSALPEDTIFGGWWNFDPQDQYFSCIPGTHTEVRGHGGFAKISGEGMDQRRTLVTIPPGHIIIFYEHIVHEVLGSKAKDTMVRLFLGWRVTRDGESLTDPVVFGNQGVVRIKSGQMPSIYSKFHLTRRNFPKLQVFAAKFKEVCKEERVVGGRVYRIPRREMLSLREYGLPMYPAYTEEELGLFVPS